jgi:hypothetical protein
VACAIYCPEEGFIWSPAGSRQTIERWVSTKEKEMGKGRKRDRQGQLNSREGDIEMKRSNLATCKLM